MLTALPWVLVGPVAVVQLAYHSRRTGPALVLWAVAFLPVLTFLPVAAVVVAAWRRQTPALAVAALALAAQLVAVAPAVASTVRARPPAVPADAPRLRVLFANLFRHNDRLEEALRVLAGRSADVVVLDEAALVDDAMLGRSGLGAAYPYSVPVDRVGVGMIVRSRFPLRVPAGYGGRRFPDLVVEVPGVDGPHDLRLVAVHVRSPIGEGTAAEWKAQFAQLERQLASDEHPGIAVGDFNATRWNGPYRRLLDTWDDVHDELGAPFSTSWPADRWFGPLLRIDHALVRGPVVPLRVRNVTVPGSDHRGLEVDVAVRRR